MIRIGDIVIGTLDIEGGRFTYGNRIAIGDIFSDESLSWYGKLKAAHKELYGYSCRLLPRKWRYNRLNVIVEGVRAWVAKEQELLHYTPTNDEVTAGLEEFGKKVGSLATVKALAKAYSKDPDDILRWSYSKVFGILYTDLEETLYNRRYSKVIHSKSQSNGRKYQRGR